MTPAPRAHRPTRLLGAEHFAFLRDLWRHGDLVASWDDHLLVEGDVHDPRRVAATLGWLLDHLGAIARGRAGRPGWARLLRLQLHAQELRWAVQAGLARRSAPPWAAGAPVPDGPTASLARRARLAERRLEVLAQLERWAVRAPRADDPVAGWMGPGLTALLAASSITTLGQLVQRVQGSGPRWRAGLAALSEAHGGHIVEWLERHAGSLAWPSGEGGAAGAAHRPDADPLASTTPAAGTRAEIATDPQSGEFSGVLRPLEQLELPPALDGSNGRFRRPPADCLLGLDADLPMVWSWLEHRAGPEARQWLGHQSGPQARRLALAGQGGYRGAHTLRAYRKEAERFLLWAVLQRRKALSSVTPEDCLAYRQFLLDPQPAALWCGPRGQSRQSPRWRPFEGPLSAAARRQAVAIITNLYGFLVDQQYLVGNPWRAALGVPAGRSRAGVAATPAERSLSAAQWAFVRAQLHTLVPTAMHQRLRLAFELLYATGLRLSELCAARVDDLRRAHSGPAPQGRPPETDGWLLQVTGPRGRRREVPLPERLVESLAHELRRRGLSAEVPSAGNRGAHLLGRIGPGDPRAGLAATTLYGQLKDFLRHCAALCAEQGRGDDALRLARASTHWLRHSHAAHALAAGVPVEVVQHNLGHASAATAAGYRPLDAQRRLRHSQRWWRPQDDAGEGSESA